MPFSGPFRYYSIFVLLFVTIRRFGGPVRWTPSLPISLKVNPVSTNSSLLFMSHLYLSRVLIIVTRRCPLWLRVGGTEQAMRGVCTE